MKLLFTMAVAGAALLSPTFGQMVASNDRVRIDVRVVTESDHKDLKGTSVDTVTQNKTLAIRLTGKARTPETRIVKWSVQGRNASNHNETEIAAGEVKLDLGQRGEQAVETRRVATTYTPDHSVASGRGGGRGRSRSLPRAKKVEATGTKYAGYVVKVMDGKAVVGDVSDPPGAGAKKP